MIDPVATLRNIGGIDRIVMNDGLVWLSERGDNRPCKCCAFECDDEVTITITFCGYTETFSIPIPGFGGINLDLDGGGPGESYLIADAEISCGPCGWFLSISICAFCEETNVFASDGFTALIPFADEEETLGAGYCPESGAVDLECFGDQFGIPCVTVTTASIA